MDTLDDINDKMEGLHSKELNIKSAQVKAAVDKVDITSADFERDIGEVLTAHNQIMMTLGELVDRKNRYSEQLESWTKRDYIKKELEDDDKGLISARMFNDLLKYISDTPESIILWQQQSITMLFETVKKLRSQIPRLKSQEVITESMRLANEQLKQFATSEEERNRVHNNQMATIITNNNENIKMVMNTMNSNFTSLMDIFKIELSTIGQLKLTEEQIRRSYTPPTQLNRETTVDIVDTTKEVPLRPQPVKRPDPVSDLPIFDDVPEPTPNTLNSPLDDKHKHRGSMFDDELDFIAGERATIQKSADFIDKQKARKRPRRSSRIDNEVDL